MKRREQESFLKEADESNGGAATLDASRNSVPP